MSQPCFRRRHYVASRQKREASSRTSSRRSGEMRWRTVLLLVRARFSNQEIGKAAVRIETDDAFRVGDEIRERIHVVIEQAAGRIINNIFDATDFHTGELHDAFD